MADVSVALTGVVAAGGLNFANPIATYEGVLFGMSAFGEAGSSPAIYVDQNAVTGTANVEVTGVLANGFIVGVDIPTHITGLETTASLGTTTLDLQTNINAAKVWATAVLTGIEVQTDVSFALEGVSGQSLVGGVDVPTYVTGVNADTALGTPTLSLGAGVNAVGTVATSQLGIEDVTADANTTTTNVSATGQVGGVNVPIYVTGVSATTYVNINLFPMSEGTLLGFSAFGELNTQTSYVRPLVVTADANALTDNVGLQVVGQVGSVSVRAEAQVNVLGVSATGQAGLVDVPVNVSGVSGTATLGSVVVAADSNVYPINVFATGVVGDTVVSADANVSASGVSAEAQVGGVDVPTYVTGVASTGVVGSVVVAADSNVIPLGVFATGQVKSVRIWSNVDNAVATNWVDIAA